MTAKGVPKGFGQGLFERLRKIIYNPRTDAQPCKAELFTVDCPRVKMIVIEKVSEGQRLAVSSVKDAARTTRPEVRS